MNKQQYKLRWVFVANSRDERYARRLLTTLPNMPLINPRAAVHLLCHWATTGGRVLAMQAGVDLALLYPALNPRLRRTVVRHLMPVFTSESRPRHKEACAYALQYSKSPAVMNKMRALLRSPSIGRRLRDIVADTVRFYPENMKQHAEDSAHSSAKRQSRT
jgi:hypothetical protein